MTDMERRGLHHHGVLGGIAAAAACAKLMKLDQHEITMAMGMAGSMGGGLLQSEGSMTKPLLGGIEPCQVPRTYRLTLRSLTPRPGRRHLEDEASTRAF